jgi:hypothetical protein
MWSAKAVALVSVMAIAVTTVLVFLLGHRSTFVEMQITLLIVSLSLFTFLTVGLYKGIRIKKERLIADKWKPFDYPYTLDIVSDFLDIGDGLVGIVISFLAWIAISIILLFLLWLLLNALWLTVFALGIAICWVFYRALRLVFIKSRICRGKILPSIGYSLLFTALYAGWIFGLTWVSKYLVARL